MILVIHFWRTYLSFILSEVSYSFLQKKEQMIKSFYLAPYLTCIIFVEAECLYMDGTFQTSPCQIFSIYIVKYGQTYIAGERGSPKSRSIELTSSSQHRGCYYHYSQAISLFRRQQHSSALGTVIFNCTIYQVHNDRWSLQY